MLGGQPQCVLRGEYLSFGSVAGSAHMPYFPAL
jgi:hypothetical protein